MVKLVKAFLHKKQSPSMRSVHLWRLTYLITSFDLGNNKHSFIRDLFCSMVTDFLNFLSHSLGYGTTLWQTLSLPEEIIHFLLSSFFRLFPPCRKLRTQRHCFCYELSLFFVVQAYIIPLKTFCVSCESESSPLF